MGPLGHARPPCASPTTGGAALLAAATVLTSTVVRTAALLVAARPTGAAVPVILAPAVSVALFGAATASLRLPTPRRPRLKALSRPGQPCAGVGLAIG